MTGLNVAAQNPYLPLWEYIPDGEPYLFEDPDNPGRMRVYVYGSHDSLIKAYCGREQVVWSAPEDNLTEWRYDGVIFESKKDAEGNWLYDNYKITYHGKQILEDIPSGGDGARSGGPYRIPCPAYSCRT